MPAPHLQRFSLPPPSPLERRDSKATKVWSSAPPRLHACIAAPEFPGAAPATRLQRVDDPPRPRHHTYIATPRALYRFTSTSTRLRLASRAPYLHTSNPPCRHTARFPASIASQPPFQYVATPISSLRISIPTRRYTCNEPPAIYTSILPRRSARSPLALQLYTSTSPGPSAPPDVQSSIPPYLHTFMSARRHACSAAPGLHIQCPYGPASIYLQLASSAQELHASTSTHLQRDSSAPYLHIATPAARLQRFITPCVHIATPASRLQGSRAPY